MKKTFFVTLVASLFSVYTFSQTTVNDQLNPIITGVPSLGITPDARAGGMGDVGAGTKPDENSQYWNPAKYAFMESEVGFAFSYTPWLSKLVSDIDLAYLAGYWRFADRQSLSASLRYFSLGEVNLTDYDARITHSIRPNEFAIDVAYSILLSEKFSGAVALRYIRSDLTNGTVENMYPGNSVAADVAFYYRTPIAMATGDGALGVGFNVSNMGPKISYDEFETSNFLPTNMRLGASFDYPIDDYNRISVSADLNKLLVPALPRLQDGETSSDYQTRLNEYYDISAISGIFNSFSDAPGGFKEELKEIVWAVGVEYAYNNQFFVRGGYFHENEIKGNRKFFTAGLGFKLNIFELNAGYVISVAQTNPLDGTLRLGLSFDLFGLRNLAY